MVRGPMLRYRWTSATPRNVRQPCRRRPVRTSGLRDDGGCFLETVVLVALICAPPHDDDGREFASSARQRRSSKQKSKKAESEANPFLGECWHYCATPVPRMREPPTDGTKRISLRRVELFGGNQPKNRRFRDGIVGRPRLLDGSVSCHLNYVTNRLKRYE